MSANADRPPWYRRIWRHWSERHRQPINFALHLVGIPMTIAALPCLVLGWWIVSAWWWAIGLIVIGYALQFIGHVIEGNDPGEIILIKRWLGLPYIAVAPSRNSKHPASDEIKTAEH